MIIRESNAVLHSFCSAISVLGAASVVKITKILEHKAVVTRDKFFKSLPRQIHPSTDLFFDDSVSQEKGLPPR